MSYMINIKNYKRKNSVRKKNIIEIFIFFSFFPIYMYASVLSDSAAACAVGEFIVLPTNNFGDPLLNHGSGNVLIYCDEGVWDSEDAEVFVIGSGYGVNSRCIRYVESTNTWLIVFDSGSAPWPKIASSSHGYEHTAIDVTGRKLYHRPGGASVWYWDLDSEGSWTKSSTYGGGVDDYYNAIEFFPDTDSLFCDFGFYTKVCYKQSTNSWGTAQSPQTGEYHTMAHYNPVGQWIGFGGGEGSYGDNFFKYNTSGDITQLADFPVTPVVSANVLTVDPVSGDFILLTENGPWYKYEASSNTWSSLSGTPDPYSYGNAGLGGDYPVVAIPIDTYGVIMFCKYNGNNSRVWIYKHSNTTTPINYPPSIPQNVLVSP